MKYYIIAILCFMNFMFTPIAVAQENEFETAQIIWDSLKELELNDYVCAGIMGNIMVEAGGYTLNIDSNDHTYNYYGICQWSKQYYPEIFEASLEEQCNFLKETIEEELNAFGFLYATGFDYKKFLELNDAENAALAFAKAYERCGSASYAARQECAIIAYEYFTEL